MTTKNEIIARMKTLKNLGPRVSRLIKKPNKMEICLRWLEEWRRKGLSPGGDYLEFGCYRGASAMQFERALQKQFSGQPPSDRYHMYLFDSFVGLPEPKGSEDQHPSWRKGVFDVGGAKAFEKILTDSGIAKSQFTQVEGFYEESLKKFDWSKIETAAFVNMDCDYFTSTVCALDAVAPKLKNFSLIYFDDLHSFSGNPHKGQLRAISEFNEKNRGVLGIEPCPILKDAAEGRIYWVWRN